MKIFTTIFYVKKVCFMKRSRAFILSEQLMTIMLQAGFILVLCASFYQVMSFYTRTQQVLTARNHAERVISFMDDKIRNAGLGLWGCGNSCESIRNALKPFIGSGKPLNNFRLPIAVTSDATHTTPQTLNKVQYGSYLTLLYGDRDLDDSRILIVTQHNHNAQSVPETGGKYLSTLCLLDGAHSDFLSDNLQLVKKLFLNSEAKESNIERYAVTEATGVPMYIHEMPEQGPTKGQIKVYTYGSPLKLAAASELIPLKCMQMFVHDKKDGQGRQFAFRELVEGGTGWNETYNQEKGILEIYMELDTEKYTFTLWVLATGGYDASMNNPRPDTWPTKAHPTATEWTNDNNNDYKDYKHHIVYVSRATWKLNNIPQGFTWD